MLCDFLLNKAGYTATEVTCGWAGAIFEVTRPFGQEQWGQRKKIIKKVKCDRPTDQPINRPTDNAGCRVACTRLKIVSKQKCNCYPFVSDSKNLRLTHFELTVTRINVNCHIDYGHLIVINVHSERLVILIGAFRPALPGTKIAHLFEISLR